MREFILDVSIIIKWFKTSKEAKVEESQQFLSDFLKDKIKIFIPPVALMEFINVAVYDKSLTSDRWKINITEFLKLSIPVVDFDGKLYLSAFEIAKQFEISAYDASYIAVAKHFKTEFITADDKLVKKVNLPFVKAL